MSANDDLDSNELLIKSETEVEPVLIIESNNNKEDLIDQIKKDKEEKKVQQIVKDYSTQRDGYLHANCFSKLFFYWAFRIIKVNYLILLILLSIVNIELLFPALE